MEDKISFSDLHDIIQTVMGWENDHRFSFEVNGQNIGIAFADHEINFYKDSEKTQLWDLLKKESMRFFYTYDFGDNWEHTIVIEKILKKDSTKEYPVCIQGECACPPEDCGGVVGYEDLLEIQKDKNHPQYHDRIVGWLGTDFDSQHFDIDKVNQHLPQMSK